MHTNTRVATSIKINPELWKKAKIQAINKEIELSQLVELAIDEWIKKQGKTR